VQASNGTFPSWQCKHVDAVEIDPRIQQIGSQVNPNKPYDDPRVSVHINDGRAFLSGNDDKYDLIGRVVLVSLSVLIALCGLGCVVAEHVARPQKAPVVADTKSDVIVAFRLKP
jgi:predicted membrane-bound spermidine synthase